MEPKFDSYLDAIEVPGPIKARLAQLLDEFSPLLGGPPEHLFVSDTFDAGGIRRQMSAFAFARGHLIELKNFIQADNFDLTVLHNNVEYLYVAKGEYDLVTATTKSRMSVLARFGGALQLAAQFYAAANNCPVLAEMLKNLLIPNMAIR